MKPNNEKCANLEEKVKILFEYIRELHIKDAGRCNSWCWNDIKNKIKKLDK